MTTAEEQYRWGIEATLECLSNLLAKPQPEDATDMSFKSHHTDLSGLELRATISHGRRYTSKIPDRCKEFQSNELLRASASPDDNNDTRVDYTTITILCDVAATAATDTTEATNATSQVVLSLEREGHVSDVLDPLRRALKMKQPQNKIGAKWYPNLVRAELQREVKDMVLPLDFWLQHGIRA